MRTNQNNTNQVQLAIFKSFEIVKGLADLSDAIEDWGNICFLCDYQPCNKKNCTENHFPHDDIHEGIVEHHDCLIALAAKLRNELKALEL